MQSYPPARPRAPSSRSGCGCTMSIGAIRARRRCCWSMAGATIAATGIVSPTGCATGSISSRRICADTATVSGRRAATMRMAAYIYDLAQLVDQPAARPGDDHCAFAGRHDFTALCRPLSRKSRAHRLDRGAWTFAEGAGRAAGQTLSRATCARGSTSSAASPAASRGAMRASAKPSSACGREQALDRGSGASISPASASTRTRTAPTAGSSTTTCGHGRRPT